MIKKITQIKILLVLFILLFNFTLKAQALIRVRVLSVSVLNNEDCDGWLTGDSDFVWEFTGTDNTLGYTNNNPALLGILSFNYAYKNGDNGPYTLNSPSGTFEPNDGMFFSHDYICSNDVPTQINLDWEAYENDDATNYSLLGFNDGQTGVQSVSMPVPAATGVLFYTFAASSNDAGCPQDYEIHLQVERLPLVVSYFQDNICDATTLALNTTYTRGWCGATLEPNEPAASDVQAS